MKLNRLPPNSFRNSWWVCVLSTKASVRPSMSWPPCGEVTTTIVRRHHLGPETNRVTGPPASRSLSKPVWNVAQRTQLLPQRQRVLRCQWQCLYVDGVLGGDHGGSLRSTVQTPRSTVDSRVRPDALAALEWCTTSNRRRPDTQARRRGQWSGRCRSAPELVESRERSIKVALVEDFRAADEVARERQKCDQPPLGVKAFLRGPVPRMGDDRAKTVQPMHGLDRATDMWRDVPHGAHMRSEVTGRDRCSPSVVDVDPIAVVAGSSCRLNAA